MLFNYLLGFFRIIAATVRVINLTEGLRIDARIRITGQSQWVQLEWGLEMKHTLQVKGYGEAEYPAILLAGMHVLWGLVQVLASSEYDTSLRL